SVWVSASQSGRCSGTPNDNISYYTRSEGSFSFRPLIADRIYDVEVEFSVPSGPTFAAIDYVTVCYERKSSLVGMSSLEMFYSRQNVGDGIRITGWQPGFKVWGVNGISEVTECTVSTDGMFRVARTDVDRYYAFNPSAQQHRVEIMGESLVTQNLHASHDDADMLIITSKELFAEANQLARIHSDYQNLNVKVVDQDAIFNEFSSGTPHPEAYRRLAQMCYRRSSGRLKYMLLYGGGRYDNRVALASDSASVLTYQCELPQYQNLSTTVYAADVYFGMVNDNRPSDNIYYQSCDVAVGRLPVNDKRQASAVNGKILRYLQSSMQEPLMNRALIICDDKDRNSHLEQAEHVIKIIGDATSNSVTCTKLYHALYPLDSNNDASAGRKTIKNMLQNGVGFMCYTGHTNGIYLTGHRIWGIGSIAETVVNHPPLVMWSTCDAYEFDRSRSDLTQCAVFVPTGGAIGAIGACRTVYQDYNGVLMYAVADSLYRAESGVMMGEVFRRARNGVVSKAAMDNDPKLGVNTLCYNYCGDPALPFYNASYGISAKVDGDRMRTMALNSISGSIINSDGSVALDFNGMLTATVYDTPYSKSTYQRGSDEVVSVTLDEEVLAEKSVPVVNGVFNMDMFVPHSIRQGAEMRMTLFAVSGDGMQRATGAVCNIHTDLSDNVSDELANDAAPRIEKVYIDSPAFTAGDVVGANCHFYAVVRGGAVGINVVQVSVGMAPDLRLDGRHSVKLNVGYLDNGDMRLSA
ncbi:MAG: hypothetical protein K2M65_05590, partial [Muribaculaceae bacterium]|nr:hypothetical protein [Muribaculaceae bacterium]